MYEEHFGLSGSPFRLNPDPNFYFGSESHNKAIAYLHYGLKQAEGFIVITGPIGAGKSMVISHLIDQLDQSNVIAAELLTSNIEPSELLRHILSSFRVEAAGEGRAAELEAFEDYLFDQLNAGRRALLIVDEAQNLPHETLEELRMLSNIDYEGTPLFQVFLVGQPEFRKTMAADEMEQ
ncbi:MAG: AAA family ATPase, partial [Marinicaulis sp.]|nr:AAA family ATPase [Marinicaulis sp.]